MDLGKRGGDGGLGGVAGGETVVRMQRMKEEYKMFYAWILILKLATWTLQQIT